MKENTKKFVAALLAFIMCIGVFPLSVLAEDFENVEESAALESIETVDESDETLIESNETEVLEEIDSNENIEELESTENENEGSEIPAEDETIFAEETEVLIENEAVSTEDEEVLVSDETEVSAEGNEILDEIADGSAEDTSEQEDETSTAFSEVESTGATEVSFDELESIINDESFAGGTVILSGNGQTYIADSVISLTSSQTYTIDLNGNTIDGNNATQIFNISAGDVTIINGTLTRGYAANGGAVYVSNASLTIGCDVTYSNATFLGGGIYANGSSVVVNGGLISNNTVASSNPGSSFSDGRGGGMYVSTSTLTINGGVISNNTAANYGGGVCTDSSDITINDGIISENATEMLHGGGLCALNNQNGGNLPVYVNINGGEVSNNEAGTRASELLSNIYLKNSLDGHGGGLHLQNVHVNITNGKISGNTGNRGGGLSIDSCKSFNMSGGEISGNSGKVGGGIYISSKNENTITAGQIVENIAIDDEYPYSGGGIYVNSGSTLTLKNAIVTGNAAVSANEGSGISGCGTAGVKMFLNSGGAVFGNSGASYEVSAISDKTTTSKYYTYFSPVMLGGGYYNWNSIDDLNTVGRTESVAANNDPSENDQAKAGKAAKVIIANNIGAGIGTNGNVVFGTASEKPYLVKMQSVNGKTPTADELTAYVGDTVTYYLIIANETEENQTVTVTDTVPEGMTLDEKSIESSGGTYNAETRTITWNDFSVSSLSTKTVIFDVTIDDSDEDAEYKNQAEIEDIGQSNEVKITLGTTSVTIPVTKNVVVKDGNANSTSFTFNLYENDELKDTAIIESTGGKTAFDTIEYTKIGEYTYTVTEQNDGVKGWSYDDTEWYVTVTVSYSKESGTLTSEISKVTNSKLSNTSSDLTEIVFTNSYTPAPVTVSIPVEKTLSGQTAPVTPSFTFVLADNNGNEQTKAIEGSGEVEFSIELSETGSYTYTVAEETDEPTGWTYDKSVYTVTVDVADKDGNLEADVSYTKDDKAVSKITFENRYIPESASIVIPVEKKLTGQTSPVEETFTFTLSGDGYSDTKTITGNGTAEFDKITYTEAGTHTYTVEESAGNATGWIYDRSVYIITAEVTDKGGYLEATVSYVKDGETVDGIVFENQYIPESTSVVIPVEKKLTGQTSPAKETFSFTLSGNGYSDTKIITGNGSAEFDRITYTEAGIYTYTVKEIAGKATGWTYDDSIYSVTVTVSDENGILRASIKYEKDGKAADNIVFVNDYAPKATSVIIPVEKKITGIDSTKTEFEFVLTDSTGNLIDTKSVTGTGKTAFDEIFYGEAGKYVYTVIESNESVSNWTYDNSIYTVTISVKDINGILTADVSYEKNEAETDSIVFENVYTVPTPSYTPTIPVTPSPVVTVTPEADKEDSEIEVETETKTDVEPEKEEKQEETKEETDEFGEEPETETDIEPETEPEAEETEDKTEAETETEGEIEGVEDSEIEITDDEVPLSGNSSSESSSNSDAGFNSSSDSDWETRKESDSTDGVPTDDEPQNYTSEGMLSDTDSSSESLPEEGTNDSSNLVSEIPQTGDTSIIWLAVLLLSGIGIAILLIISRKASKKNHK